MSQNATIVLPPDTFTHRKFVLVRLANGQEYRYRFDQVIRVRRRGRLIEIDANRIHADDFLRDQQIPGVPPPCQDSPVDSAWIEL
jgi:hypothetical protein